MVRFIQKKDGFDVPHLDPQTYGIQNFKTPLASTAERKSRTAWRYYIATLGSISLFMMNCQRMALAVAVVNMSNFTSVGSEQRNFSQESCPIRQNSTVDTYIFKTGGDFNWTPQLQGFIIGSAFLGYAFITIAAGRMSDKFGAKRIIFWGNMIAAGGLLLFPTLSWWSAHSLIAVQLIRGMAQGFLWSATYVMIANWTPRRERGFISSVIFTGSYAGSMGGGLIAGVLCQSPFLGWASVYYILGTAGILFSILFILTFYETPNDHPRISEFELKYIIEDQVKNNTEKKPPTPWLRMFTSIPTYALLFGVFVLYWKVMYFLSVHPAYLSNILHYSIFKSGLVASLPFILKIIASLSSSALVDWLYRNKYVGVDKLRRGVVFIGASGFGLSMLGLYFAECNELLNILFFSTALVSAGSATPGAMISAVDMTPNFAATLMGIISTFASMSGFIIPVAVGYLTKDQTLEGWQNVFLMNIAVAMVCGTVFAAFGSAKVQPWNFADENSPINGNGNNPPTDGNNIMKIIDSK